MMQRVAILRASGLIGHALTLDLRRRRGFDARGYARHLPLRKGRR
jgi:hypothetical protein